MEDKFKKGINDIKQIKLSPKEKSVIFDSLNNHIKSSPVFQGSIKSPWYKSTGIFVSSHLGYVTSTFLILCLVGISSVSSVSSSLPGDKLYSIKVDVIEPLKYSIAFGTLAKANVESDNIASRLSEVELLELKGRLTDSSQKDLETRLKKHTDSFNSLVATSVDVSSSTENIIETRVDFEAKMNVHSRILDEIYNNKSGIKDNLVKIKKVVEEEKEKAKDERKKIEDNFLNKGGIKSNITTTTNNSIFEGKKKTTEALIKKTKKNIEKNLKTNNRQINQGIIFDTNTSINKAESSLESADKENISGNRTKAFSDLLNSRKFAQEADTSFRAIKNLEEGD